MWLSDFKLVLPDRIIENGSILVEHGRIADILDHPVQSGVDGRGAYILPGFVDMHGDMIELEMEPRTNVHFPIEVALPHLDARLAAAGVTTAYAAVSFSRSARKGERRSFEHTSNVIRSLYRLKGDCRVDHKIHARFDITFDNAVGVLQDLVNDDQVDLVSLMDHTPGQGQYRDIERHIQLTAQRQKVSEDEARQSIEERIERRKRPEEEILNNIRKVSEICKVQGVSLASHDDDTVQKANLMADIGAVIAEFPVALEAARATAARGMMNAMGAPNAMRGQSYSGNLSARQAHQEGLLHILASDYHPAAILASVFILAKSDPNGLPGAVALASANPAKALGLSDRGQLAIGQRADLCIVERQRATRVIGTLSEGNVIYSAGLLTGLTPKSCRAA
ncbi:alpha-D-ribose 1-methylphosphonate 5-triphosphate diphosphatase [uncultured Cohaesibacter sp.]|uniref:alpha-D-ribose 1-methylphosphonate 5-triphosphate diphosphatase n=1 Tax=uncultured Cohaesibacter sp. TaxID=1002546 RepID=UPI00292EBEAE|nr:alpha-D-ribose 1-methylphosphonate 5-triphosphate diphosphatase [uncultured Cohaesibacter sp.]